jgi:hypothetical protein
MAYVAILVLLAIMSVLGFGFIFKVNTQNSVTLNRGQSMQAHYLAESAANHSLWGLLNQPGFAPASDVYYMHDLGNGKYGYKVRKPTETTFTTVATVGAIGDSVVNQSYVQYIVPYNIITLYGDSSNPNTKYRRLIGANWTDPVIASSGSTPNIHWAVTKGCPVRKEIISGVIDSNDDITFTVWKGSSPWTNTITFSADADRNFKCFDITYESQSGDALMVGRNGITTTVYYDKWDGTQWTYSTAQPAFNITSGAIQTVIMASCPGSNDILIATLSWNNELELFHWNGSTFSNLGIIESSMNSDDYGSAQIVYERQSGDALVIWSARGSMRYMVWNGSTLGPEQTISDFTSDVKFFRAADDPTSDHIVLAGTDKFYDITVTIWDGTAWTDSRVVETGCANDDKQGVDVAWEATGEDALIVWAPWGLTNVRALAWRKGTALADSTIQEGPDLQNQPWLVRLHPIYQSEKIILLGENNLNDLRYCLWNGNQLKGDPAILLEANIPVNGDVAFDLAEALVPLSGGSGTGVGTNQPPVVDAGPDQTIFLPSDATLDGTVTDDGKPNPPSTVTSTWSKISGPGTVTFGDSSLVDTTATFSEPGTYVLRLTADDSELSDFDEVTIIVDSCGLLYIVASASSLSSEESLRKIMMEGWGWTVTLIDDGESQANFDVAAAANDVAYVSQQAVATMLGSKMNNTPIGVVNENKDMIDDFGFATGLSIGGGLPTLNVDMTHYITSVFTANPVAPYVANDWYQITNEPVATGVDPVGTWVEAPWTGKPALMALSMGDTLIGGGSAAGRRVQIPWGSGQGSTPVALASLSADARTIMKRAIEWAANEEGGCGSFVACNPDYVPATKVEYFSTSAYGSGFLEGIAYIPFGKSFYSQAVPAGGALISVDMGSDMFYFTDLAGNLIASLTSGSGTNTGVTLVQIGTWANHLAVSDKFSDEIKYFDLSGNFISSFSTNVSADFDSSTPEDVAFIGNTTSGTYNYHLAIPDPGRNKIFLVDQDGNWVSSIDIAGIVTNVSGAVHIPETDKLLLVNVSGQAFIVDFAGNLWNQYDTTSFGTSSVKAITINTLTCDHLVGDPSNDLVVMLNLGGSGDTDPPTPDPMTWASPPATVDAFSITMTATTASDPNGVQYYFECTAGGGNDSGWVDSPIYVDTGLQPNTLYTYRVKARDKSVNHNESGWSTEASATTSSNVIYVYDITMGYGTAPGNKYFGQATVWIKGAGGANIVGAVVSGDWSGAVSETSMGSTGSDGKVTLESSNVKNGGTFIFTVTGVLKTDYTYNPSLNVETSDSITAP